MAPTAKDHTRRRNLLLFQKLLNLRDGASPFTLVLDTLEQPAGPIIAEFALRAKKLSKAKIIYLRQSTLRPAPHADVLVNARGRELSSIKTELLTHCPPPDIVSEKQAATQRAVVIIDSLNPLASAATDADELGALLSSIISPVVSLVAIYHADVPLVPPPPSHRHQHNEYAAAPLTLLSYLATAILRVSSLHHEVERHRARHRSLEEPEFGLGEGKEGILVGLHAQPPTTPHSDAAASSSGTAAAAMVVAMELRRRSGRVVTETFVVTFPGKGVAAREGGDDGQAAAARSANLCLLDAHPAFAPPPEADGGGGGDDAGGGAGSEEPESTFNLGLTEKQRRDREGIVLPYFDAQTDIGTGEGGRILYDMGREDMDDFDDEEDEEI